MNKQKSERCFLKNVTDVNLADFETKDVKKEGVPAKARTRIISACSAFFCQVRLVVQKSPI